MKNNEQIGTRVLTEADVKRIVAESSSQLFSPEALKVFAAEVAKQLQWPEVMDIDTAARYISSGYDAVWLMIKRREVPVVTRGNRKFLRRIDLDKWAERSLV